jgi:hypothetical protein
VIHHQSSSQVRVSHVTDVLTCAVNSDHGPLASKTSCIRSRTPCNLSESLFHKTAVPHVRHIKKTHMKRIFTFIFGPNLTRIEYSCASIEIYVPINNCLRIYLPFTKEIIYLIVIKIRSIVVYVHTYYLVRKKRTI